MKFRLYDDGELTVTVPITMAGGSVELRFVLKRIPTTRGDMNEFDVRVFATNHEVPDYEVVLTGDGV